MLFLVKIIAFLKEFFVAHRILSLESSFKEGEFKLNFVIDKIDGLQPEFSKLVSMMNYARHTTMQAVEGLTIEELDYLYDEEANSIGMLLYHMAAIEFYYQIHTFEDREPTEAELERWFTCY